MSDIAEFLTARLDEDEQVARSATSSPWRIDERHPHVVLEPEPIDSVGVAGERYDLFTGQLSSRFGQAKLDVIHIVRHDPARVLAEVAAKRAVIDRLRSEQIEQARSPNPSRAGVVFGLLTAVRELARTYSDHSDYDPD